ncbi:MAG: glycoside hydrolase family 16 protein [Bacillus subtilis]|nr:glycoside hydrolase family 16 protein [Bacillus subtilis]
MFKKILILTTLSLAMGAIVGCGLVTETTTGSTTESTTQSTEPTTSETTTGATSTETSTDLTTTGTTTGATTTRTSLIDLIPEECSDIAIVDGWIPTWCDEFEASLPTTIIDPTKWTYHTGGGGFGNQELQYYKNADPDNIAIRDGALVITALKEVYSTNNYTSTKLWTQATTSFKYGKIEMRAKLPFGRGTWPAFWMMPKTSKYGGWPDSGEIDIMEHVGYDMNTVLGTVHTERFSGTNGRGGSTDSLIPNTVASIDVANTYHTYGIIWNEERIEWYFDGYLFGSVEADEKWGNGYSADTSVDWPFDQSFYIILNLAIGGTWGGAQGVDDSIFPATLTVDYVRVYQQDYVTGDAESPPPSGCRASTGRAEARRSSRGRPPPTISASNPIMCTSMASCPRKHL